MGKATLELSWSLIGFDGNMLCTIILKSLLYIWHKLLIIYFPKFNRAWGPPILIQFNRKISIKSTIIKFFSVVYSKRMKSTDSNLETDMETFIWLDLVRAQFFFFLFYFNFFGLIGLIDSVFCACLYVMSAESITSRFSKILFNFFYPPLKTRTI